MSTQIRAELHRFIDLADDRFVSAIYAMMQNYLQSDESIVAYSSSGEPLSKAKFVANVLQAYKEAKNGKRFTTEQVIKEMEKW